MPCSDAYVRATGAKVQLMTWGANRCRTLASDLARMHDRGWLKKSRVGLGGNWQPGFPRWVNSYSLSGVGRDAFDAMTSPDRQGEPGFRVDRQRWRGGMPPLPPAWLQHDLWQGRGLSHRPWALAFRWRGALLLPRALGQRCRHHGRRLGRIVRPWVATLGGMS